MKKYLLTSCCLILIGMICSTGLFASGGDKNFCYNADVPEAQDNLSAMCLTAPTLFCPATYLGCPTDNTDPSNTGFPIALPGDASCPNPIVSFTDEVITDNGCTKIIHRTWEATYPPGSASIKLHSSCQQTIFLEDLSAPVINNCPADIVIDLSENCDSTVTWSLPTVEDDCGIQLFLTTNFSGTIFPSGTTTVTYTAQDFCGNVTLCSFDVTIAGSCCNAPDIVCPADVISCPVTGDITPSSTGEAVATPSDPSCGIPSVTFTDVVTSTGPCTGQQEIVRTWTATDASDSSLSSSCSQQISVIDNNNPIITNTPSNITVNGNGSNCQVAVTWTPPSVSDDCGIASFTSSNNSGDLFTEGVHTVTYTAVDNCGNTVSSSFTVTVNCICNVPPVLNCPADYVSCPSNPSIDPSVTGQATATAGDPVCGTPALNFADNILTSGPCANATTLQRTWTATVQNNNALTTECVQQITIQDLDTPTIGSFPQNITVFGSGNNCTVPVTWNEPTATDACGIASFTSTFTSGHSFSSGITVVTYTAVDNCGNSTSLSFNVTVICNLCDTPPTLTCPADYLGCPANGYPTSALTGTASAIITGANCNGLPVITFEDIINSQGPCSNAYDITRVWTATDPNDPSLSVSCSQSIITEDNIAPTLTNTPTDLTVHASGPACSVPVKWAQPIVSDNCGSPNLTSNFDSGDNFTQGVTTVIYTASDNCGNTAFHSFNVTVECAACTAPPTLTCPSNYTVCPGNLLPSPSVSGIATATSSGSCGTPFVFYSDFIISFGSCIGAYTANRTWTAFDPLSGLSSTCVQVIQLDDISAPTISNVPQDITISATGGQANYSWTTPTVDDICGISSFNSNFNSGHNFPLGTTTVEFTITDNCGNVTTASFNVTVEAAGCATPPNITCPATFVDCPGSNFPGPAISGMATAIAGSSDCGTPVLTYSDVMSSFGSCTGALTFSRNWVATDPDDSSIFSTCSQTIVFEDNDVPTITNIPADIVVTGNGNNCLVPVTWIAPTANDNCGIASLNSNFGIGHNFSEGVTVVTYTALDNCGNSTTASFTITVNCLGCTTPPAITCPQNIVACIGASTSPSFTGLATAVNNGANCSGTPVVTFTDLVNNIASCAGAQVIQRNWIASDLSTGLNSTCTQTITLEDNDLPIITNLPADIVVTGNGSNCLVPVTWTLPTANDNCGIQVLSSNINGGHSFSEGTTVITYTAVDNCGNSSTASFNVTVNCVGCTTPPTITCPGNITACIGANTSPSFTGLATGITNGANCNSAPAITFTDVINSTGTCAGAQLIQRNWIASNISNGLNSSCTQTITLTDTTPPTISNVPNNIAVTSMTSSCQAPVTWVAPTATDLCGSVTLTSSVASGTSFTEGITTVIYTATDACGNVSTASFTVTVDCGICNSAPSITCPANFESCVTSAGIPNPIVSGFAFSVINGPNCSGSPYMTFNDQVVATGTCAGALEIARTWISTDPANKLHSTCVQTISLVDSTLPSIAGVPTNISITANGNGCSAPVTWTEPTAFDNCGVASLSSNSSNGQVFSEGTTTVIYTATDFCGNATTASFTVTVNCIGCTTPPNISCPGAVTACPSADTSPSLLGIASATNNGTHCVGVPQITFTDIVNPIVSCQSGQIIQRTWTATDPNTGIASNCLQTITLEDNTPPTFANVPANITVNGVGAGCSVPVSWSIPTAIDACGMASEPLSTHVSGTAFGEGTTTVVYTATDQCGNASTASFTVTVNCTVCNTPPAITCPGNLTICPDTDSSPSFTGVATAAASNAACTGTISVSFTDIVNPIVPCAAAQLIQRTWVAVDQLSGLNSSCVQTITRVDNEPPTIHNLPADIVVNGTGANCSVPVTWTAPTATDDCSMAGEPLSQHVPGSNFSEGVTTVTYTATDQCGNTRTASFRVTVLCATCTTPPSISCPANIVDCPSAPISPASTGFAVATVSGSHCSGTPTVSYTDNVVSTGPCAGAQLINRVWLATDNNTGLTNSCTQIISLEDTNPPVITEIPADITVHGAGSGCSAAATWTVPSAVDNCGISGVPTCQYTVGSLFDEGITTVTYTATDDCGNTSTASFTITVVCAAVCETAPTISCPVDYTTCPSATIPTPAIAGTATAFASGTHCGTPVISYSDAVISSGPCPNAQHIQRTWTATDPNIGSLSSSCIQNIYLEDNTPPALANCPAGLVIAGMTTMTGSGTGSGSNGGGTICTGIALWTTPTASDDCGTASVVCTDQSGTVVNSGDSFPAGTTIVTCTATDLCGNESTCTFDIVVTCNQDCTAPPLLNCPANAAVCIGEDFSIPALGDVIVVTGPLCPAVMVTNEDIIIISSGPCTGEAIINRVWSGSYPSIPGSNTSCTQVITIENSAPVFENCPENIFIGDDQTPVFWTAPLLIDPCGTAVVTASHTSGTTFSCGTTTVSYTAEDICGNIVTCSFDVVVDCISAGGFSFCPSNMTLTCGGGAAVANWSEPIYNNTCNSCSSGSAIPGFIYMGTYGGSQYYCSVSPATWPDANANCIANGGQLVDINGAGENNFLASLLTIQSAWIGLTDVNSEGTFEWSSGAPLSYTNWYPGQPNNFNGNQDYVELLSTGEWNDQYNTYALEYIMEIPCNFVVQTSGPAPGSTLTGGTYMVTYGVTNGCNSNETCSFSITVEETMELTCPADITVTASAGAGSAPVSWDAPIANSCCSSCSSAIPGFVYMGSYNGHHYYCSTTNASWTSANNICAANGGYLASVESAGENNFLSSVLTYQSAWIGANDAASEGNFEWTSGAPFNYTNWYVGQPNNYNYNQHYVEMLSDGTWNDQYENSQLEFIMEIPDCISITQTGGPSVGSNFNVGTTTVSYSAIDGCGNSATCSFDVTVLAAGSATPCPSGGVSSANHYIESVAVGSLYNASGNDSGYGDYTNICEVIEPSTVIPIQLCPNIGNSAVMYWSVWIDYNQDGDFLDNYEFVAYGAGSQCLNGDITIPAGISNGNTTMRITSKLGSYATDPCEIYAAGETEDYCITVVNGVTLIRGRSEGVNSIKGDKATELSELDRVQEEIVHAELDVAIFPNPVSYILIIELSNSELVSQVDLYDQTGRKVKTFDNLSNTMNEDVSDLTSGMYVLSITEKNGNVTTERVMVTR